MLTSNGVLSDLEVANATQEILAAAYWRSDLWDKVSHIEPHWFPDCVHQKLWHSIQRCYALNQMVELPVLAAALREEHGNDADHLLAVLQSAADAWVHPEFLPHHVEIVERFGQRREVKQWASALLRLCDEHGSVESMRELLRDLPALLKGGVA